MSCEVSKIESRIIAAVMGQLGPSVLRDEIENDVELRNLGLDSMKSISLLLELEKEFGLIIPDDYLTPEYYGSLRGLRSMITTLLSEALK